MTRIVSIETVILLLICMKVWYSSSCIISFSMDNTIVTLEDIMDNIFTPNEPENPEEHMTVEELIRYHDYPFEEHLVTTEDGYILTLHRIPHGKEQIATNIRKKPVLFLPGLCAVSSIWLMNDPENGLPYLLADKGYDIWLGNFRGTTFGKKHTLYSPKSKIFWKFGLDEMAEYDVPNMIDFILHKTEFDELHYIGHSLGTTIAFATLSAKTEYNKKVQSFHALGPIVKLDHNRDPLFLFVAMFMDFEMLYKYLGDFEFQTNQIINEFIQRFMCKWAPRYLCQAFYLLFESFDKEQFNWKRYQIAAHSYPAGTSIRSILQYLQILSDHRFQFFDYGVEINKKKYNQSIPPLYDITKITTAVALYWAESDTFASPEDVTFLIQNLKNIILNYRVPFNQFNHEDFIWAKDIYPLVYKKLIETLERISNDNTTNAIS